MIFLSNRNLTQKPSFFRLSSFFRFKCFGLQDAGCTFHARLAAATFDAFDAHRGLVATHHRAAAAKEQANGPVGWERETGRFGKLEGLN